MTGSTGFIGKHVTDCLLRDGHLVTSVIRGGAKKAIFKPNPNHFFITTQVLQSPSVLSEAISKHDIILYCAGSVKGRKFSDFKVANVNFIKKLVRAADKLPVKPRFILISTLAAKLPKLSFYSLSKWKGERLLHDSSVEWVVLRPTAVYGPGDTELFPLLKMVSNGVCPNIIGSEQTLSLLHVRDLVLDIVEVIENFDEYIYKTIEIHDGKIHGYKWDEIKKILRKGKITFNIPVPCWSLKILAKINYCLSGMIGYNPMLTLGKVRELRYPDWSCDSSLKQLETRLKNRITLDCNASGLH